MPQARTWLSHSNIKLCLFSHHTLQEDRKKNQRFWTLMLVCHPTTLLSLPVFSCLAVLLFAWLKQNEVCGSSAPYWFVSVYPTKMWRAKAKIKTHSLFTVRPLYEKFDVTIFRFKNTLKLHEYTFTLNNINGKQEEGKPVRKRGTDVCLVCHICPAATESKHPNQKFTPM